MGMLKQMISAVAAIAHRSKPTPQLTDAAPDTEQYADDAPIASSTEDRFSRWPFAERIAHVIATRTDPASIVIGMYGP
jgi:hypothetical protein